LSLLGKTEIENTGFLQVRENWKSQGIRVVRERSGENIFFGKVREKEKVVPPDVRF